MFNAHQVRSAAAEFVQSRLGKFTLVVVVATILASAAMQYRADTYPSDWPTLATVARGTTSTPECPDLNGTYLLHAPKDTCCGFDQNSTFLTEGVANDAQIPWRTLTISGVTGRGLTLTFERDAVADSAVPRQQASVIPYGSRYRCNAGWVIGEPLPVFLYPTKADVDQNMRRRAGTLPSHFRKDVNGALVARVDARETLKFGPDARSALSIPYFSFISPRWARWSPPSAPSPSTATQQAVNNQRDPAGQNSAVETETSPISVESLARANLRDGALPGPLVKNGDVYVFTLYADNTAAIASTLRALQGDAALMAVTLNSSVKNSVGMTEATIGFRLTTAKNSN